MGIKIATQFNGTCPECETEYIKGEMVFYDKKHTNRKGNAIVCKKYECFTEQGGVLDKKSGDARTTVEDLTCNIPVIAVRDDVRIGVSVIKECIYLANLLTKEMYPNLDPLSNTYGQIRNAFKTDLVNIYNARRICDHQIK